MVQKKNLKKLVLILVVPLIGVFMVFGTGGGIQMVQANNSQDEQAIEQAILDYVEAFYEADPSKAVRSIRRDLAKQGFPWDKDAGEYGHRYMSYDQLLDLSANLFKDNPPPADTPKEITIFEIQDQTASAKLVALWGSDYFHLGKFDGKWMIVNVIWQALPKK